MLPSNLRSQNVPCHAATVKSVAYAYNGECLTTLACVQPSNCANALTSIDRVVHNAHTSSSEDSINRLTGYYDYAKTYIHYAGDNPLHNMVVLKQPNTDNLKTSGTLAVSCALQVIGGNRMDLSNCIRFGLNLSPIEACTVSGGYTTVVINVHKHTSWIKAYGLTLKQTTGYEGIGFVLCKTNSKYTWHFYVVYNTVAYVYGLSSDSTVVMHCALHQCVPAVSSSIRNGYFLIDVPLNMSDESDYCWSLPAFDVSTFFTDQGIQRVKHGSLYCKSKDPFNVLTHLTGDLPTSCVDGALQVFGACYGWSREYDVPSSNIVMHLSTQFFNKTCIQEFLLTKRQCLVFQNTFGHSGFMIFGNKLYRPLSCQCCQSYDVCLACTRCACGTEVFAHPEQHVSYYHMYGGLCFVYGMRNWTMSDLQGFYNHYNVGNKVMISSIVPLNLMKGDNFTTIEDQPDNVYYSIDRGQFSLCWYYSAVQLLTDLGSKIDFPEVKTVFDVQTVKSRYGVTTMSNMHDAISVILRDGMEFVPMCAVVSVCSCTKPFVQNAHTLFLEPANLPNSEWQPHEGGLMCLDCHKGVVNDMVIPYHLNKDFLVCFKTPVKIGKSIFVGGYRCAVQSVIVYVGMHYKTIAYPNNRQLNKVVVAVLRPKSFLDQTSVENNTLFYPTQLTCCTSMYRQVSCYNNASYVYVGKHQVICCTCLRRYALDYFSAHTCEKARNFSYSISDITFDEVAVSNRAVLTYEEYKVLIQGRFDYDIARKTGITIVSFVDNVEGCAILEKLGCSAFADTVYDIYSANGRYYVGTYIDGPPNAERLNAKKRTCAWVARCVNEDGANEHHADKRYVFYSARVVMKAEDAVATCAGLEFHSGLEQYVADNWQCVNGRFFNKHSTLSFLHSLDTLENDDYIISVSNYVGLGEGYHNAYLRRQLGLRPNWTKSSEFSVRKLQHTTYKSYNSTVVHSFKLLFYQIDFATQDLSDEDSKVALQQKFLKDICSSMDGKNLPKRVVFIFGDEIDFADRFYLKHTISMLLQHSIDVSIFTFNSAEIYAKVFDTLSASSADSTFIYDEDNLYTIRQKSENVLLQSLTVEETSFYPHHEITPGESEQECDFVYADVTALTYIRDVYNISIFANFAEIYPDCRPVLDYFQSVDKKRLLQLLKRFGKTPIVLKIKGLYACVLEDITLFLECCSTNTRKLFSWCFSQFKHTLHRFFSMIRAFLCKSRDTIHGVCNYISAYIKRCLSKLQLVLVDETMMTVTYNVSDSDSCLDSYLKPIVVASPLAIEQSEGCVIVHVFEKQFFVVRDPNTHFSVDKRIAAVINCNGDSYSYEEQPLPLFDFVSNGILSADACTFFLKKSVPLNGKIVQVVTKEWQANFLTTDEVVYYFLQPLGTKLLCTPICFSATNTFCVASAETGVLMELDGLTVNAVQSDCYCVVGAELLQKPVGLYVPYKVDAFESEELCLYLVSNTHNCCYYANSFYSVIQCVSKLPPIYDDFLSNEEFHLAYGVPETVNTMYPRFVHNERHLSVIAFYVDGVWQHAYSKTVDTPCAMLLMQGNECKFCFLNDFIHVHADCEFTSECDDLGADLSLHKYTRLTRTRTGIYCYRCFDPKTRKHVYLKPAAEPYKVDSFVEPYESKNVTLFFLDTGSIKQQLCANGIRVKHNTFVCLNDTYTLETSTSSDLLDISNSVLINLLTTVGSILEDGGETDCETEKTTKLKKSVSVVEEPEVFSLETLSSSLASVDFTELNLLLVGKTCSGKSSLGNHLLQSTVFNVKVSPESTTNNVFKYTSVVENLNLTVVDTPGFAHTSLKYDDVIDEVKKGISSFGSAPFVTLFLVRLDVRHTAEQKEAFTQVVTLLQDKPVFVVFTFLDYLGTKPAEEFISASASLKEVASTFCNYYCFSNSKPESQVLKTIIQDAFNLCYPSKGLVESSNLTPLTLEEVVEDNLSSTDSSFVLDGVLLSEEVESTSSTETLSLPDNSDSENMSVCEALSSDGFIDVSTTPIMYSPVVSLAPSEVAVASSSTLEYIKSKSSNFFDYLTVKVISNPKVLGVYISTFIMLSGYFIFTLRWPWYSFVLCFIVLDCLYELSNFLCSSLKSYITMQPASALSVSDSISKTLHICFTYLKRANFDNSAYFGFVCLVAFLTYTVYLQPILLVFYILVVDLFFVVYIKLYLGNTINYIGGGLREFILHACIIFDCFVAIYYFYTYMSYAHIQIFLFICAIKYPFLLYSSCNRYTLSIVVTVMLSSLFLSLNIFMLVGYISYILCIVCVILTAYYTYTYAFGYVVTTLTNVVGFTQSDYVIDVTFLPKPLRLFYTKLTFCLHPLRYAGPIMCFFTCLLNLASIFTGYLKNTFSLNSVISKIIYCFTICILGFVYFVAPFLLIPFFYWLFNYIWVYYIYTLQNRLNLYEDVPDAAEYDFYLSQYISSREYCNEHFKSSFHVCVHYLNSLTDTVENYLHAGLLATKVHHHGVRTLYTYSYILVLIGFNWPAVAFTITSVAFLYSFDVTSVLVYATILYLAALFSVANVGRALYKYLRHWFLGNECSDKSCLVCAYSSMRTVYTATLSMVNNHNIIRKDFTVVGSEHYCLKHKFNCDHDKTYLNKTGACALMDKYKVSFPTLNVGYKVVTSCDFKLTATLYVGAEEYLFTDTDFAAISEWNDFILLSGNLTNTDVVVVDSLESLWAPQVLVYSQLLGKDLLVLPRSLIDDTLVVTDKDLTYKTNLRKYIYSNPTIRAVIDSESDLPFVTAKDMPVALQATLSTNGIDVVNDIDTDTLEDYLQAIVLLYPFRDAVDYIDSDHKAQFQEKADTIPKSWALNLNASSTIMSHAKSGSHVKDYGTTGLYYSIWSTDFVLKLHKDGILEGLMQKISSVGGRIAMYSKVLYTKASSNSISQPITPVHPVHQSGTYKTATKKSSWFKNFLPITLVFLALLTPLFAAPNTPVNTFLMMDGGSIYNVDWTQMCFYNSHPEFDATFKLHNNGRMYKNSKSCPIILGVVDSFDMGGYLQSKYLPNTVAAKRDANGNLIFFAKQHAMQYRNSKYSIFGFKTDCTDLYYNDDPSTCATYCDEGDNRYADLLPHVLYKSCNSNTMYRLPDLLWYFPAVWQTQTGVYCNGTYCFDSTQGLCLSFDNGFAVNSPDGTFPYSLCGESLSSMVVSFFTDSFYKPLSYTRLTWTLTQGVVTAVVIIFIIYCTVVFHRMFSWGTIHVLHTILAFLLGVALVLLSAMFPFLQALCIPAMALTASLLYAHYNLGVVIYPLVGMSFFMHTTPVVVIALTLCYILILYGTVIWYWFSKLLKTNRQFVVDYTTGKTTFNKDLTIASSLPVEITIELANDVLTLHTPAVIQSHASKVNFYTRQTLSSLQTTEYTNMCVAMFSAAVLKVNSTGVAVYYAPPKFQVNTAAVSAYLNAKLQTGLVKTLHPSHTLSTSVVHVILGKNQLNGLWIDNAVVFPRHILGVAPAENTEVWYKAKLSEVQAADFIIKNNTLGFAFVVKTVSLQNTLIKCVVDRTNRVSIKSTKFSVGDCFTIAVCADGSIQTLHAATMRSNHTIQGVFTAGTCGSPGFIQRNGQLYVGYLHHMQLPRDNSIGDEYMGSTIEGCMYGNLIDCSGPQLYNAAQVYSYNKAYYAIYALSCGAKSNNNCSLSEYNSWAFSNNHTPILATDKEYSSLINYCNKKCATLPSVLGAIINGLSTKFHGTTEVSDEFSLASLQHLDAVGCVAQSRPVWRNTTTSVVDHFFKILFIGIMNLVLFAVLIKENFYIVNKTTMLLGSLFNSVIICLFVKRTYSYTIGWIFPSLCYLTYLGSFRKIVAFYQHHLVLQYVTSLKFYLGLDEDFLHSWDWLYDFIDASKYEIFVMASIILSVLLLAKHVYEHITRSDLVLHFLKFAWLGFRLHSAYRVGDIDTMFVLAMFSFCGLAADNIVVFASVTWQGLYIIMDRANLLNYFIYAFLFSGVIFNARYGVFYCLNKFVGTSYGNFQYRVSAKQFIHMHNVGMQRPTNFWNAFKTSLELLLVDSSGQNDIIISRVQSTDTMKVTGVLLSNFVTRYCASMSASDQRILVNLHNKMLLSTPDQCLESLIKIVCFCLTHTPGLAQRYMESITDNSECSKVLQNATINMLEDPATISLSVATEALESAKINGDAMEIKKAQKAYNKVKAEADRNAAVRNKIQRMTETMMAEQLKTLTKDQVKGKIYDAMQHSIVSLLRRLDIEQIDKIMTDSSKGFIPARFIPTLVSTKLTIVVPTIERYLDCVCENAIEYAGVYWHIERIVDYNGGEVATVDKETLFPINVCCVRDKPILTSLQGNECYRTEVQEEAALCNRKDGTQQKVRALVWNETGKRIYLGVMSGDDTLVSINMPSQATKPIWALSSPIAVARGLYVYFLQGASSAQRASCVLYVSSKVNLQSDVTIEPDDHGLLSELAVSVDSLQTYKSWLERNGKALSVIKMVVPSSGDGSAVSSAAMATMDTYCYAGASVCLDCRACKLHTCNFKGKFVNVPRTVLDPVLYVATNKVCDWCHKFQDHCKCVKSQSTTSSNYLNSLVIVSGPEFDH